MAGGCTCDVPGCGLTRRRRQRLCERCYRALPGEICVGLTEAKHQRRDRDWRQLRKRAAEFLSLGDGATPAFTGALRHPVSPQQSYALNQRMLGERPDA
ncbi:hypothetical protein [Sphingomonas sp. PB4P5]|uniref:hypothetical protein n=1 Tax=Parasphingomonas puruogangriensis TaxID=3096155 RepID=UPI002FC695EA